eukprot:374493-Pyramimonas_sp.AAC.1
MDADPPPCWLQPQRPSPRGRRLADIHWHATTAPFNEGAASRCSPVPAWASSAVRSPAPHGHVFMPTAGTGAVS